MSPEITPGVTEDRLLGGRVLLRQPKVGYRAAIDPVLLAAALDPKPREEVTNRLVEVDGHGRW